MAKFRSNHTREGRGKFGKGGPYLRAIIFFVLICVGLAFLSNGLKTLFNETPIIVQDIKGKFYLPSGSTGEIIHHKHYSLSYVEKYEQPEWVSYILTKKSLQVKNVPRSKQFNPDNKVSTKSAVHSDYSNSGFTRGHMVPAGDMAFSHEAMKETFFMSNMSPQVRACNGGVWKELEELVRDWAYARGSLVVVSGPIIEDHFQTIGKKNKVAVPKSFFKILYDNNANQMISFIIPNQKSKERLSKYVVTVDQLESITGLDFFEQFLEDDNEEALESSISKSGWKFDQRKFKDRINNWNNM